VAGGGGCRWLAHYCASCSGAVSLGDPMKFGKWRVYVFLLGLILDHRKNTNKTSALKQTSSLLLRFFFCQSVFQVDFGINLP